MGSLSALRVFQNRQPAPTRPAPRSPLLNASEGIQTDFSKEFGDQDKLLKEKFAAARTGARSQFGEGQRQLGLGLDRQKAISGREGGESFGKALQVGQGEIAKGQAQVEAGITSAEAEAGSQLKTAQMGFQQQAEQFKAQMSFQEGSFAQQMAFQWAEFDENLKTNWINGLVALEDSGIDSMSDMQKFSDTFGGVFEGVGTRNLGFSAGDAKQDAIDRFFG